MGLLVASRIIGILFGDVDDLLVQSGHFILEVLAGLSKLRDVGLHLVLLLLSHESLAHSVRDGGLIQALIGLHCHLQFIANPHQKEATLSTVNRYLSDQFVEALRIKLLTNAADSSFPRLSSL